jgi:hypothetical protein
MSNLQAIKVLGVHPIELSDKLFYDTLEIQWGSGLTGLELEQAEQSVREHFSGLYQVEVQLAPPDAAIEWGEITQPLAAQPESNWQVPYDESVVDAGSGRWAFFFHCLDLGKPLRSPVGLLDLPVPTPRPAYLAGFEYEAPS